MIHLAKQIKLVALETLKPYERNARTHSETQIKQIAASIRERGFLNPILVDGDKGIIAGHGRLAAAKYLRMTEVPVIEITHLSEAQKKALIIADNKLAMNAGWDLEMLASEVASLGGHLEDFGSIGLTEDEVSNLLAGLEDISAEVEKITELQEAPRIQVSAQENSPVEESDENLGREDASEHWKDMPAYEQEDKTAVRRVIVHFVDQAGVDEFFSRIGQKDTGITKTVWFPPQERMDTESKRYGD